MTEPETEIATLDRLEAALQRIAAHGARPAAEAGPSRHEAAAALDRVIVHLKDALASIGEAEQE